MFEVVFFTYGLLTSFVLSGATRNYKLQRPNPRTLEYFGYGLMSCSAALSLMLFARAARMAVDGGAF